MRPGILKAPQRLLAAAALVAVVGASAGSLQVQVLDREGRPTADAVVVLYPGAGTPAAPLATGTATVAQERMRFVPALTVLPVGSTLRFTNQDPWDHHVRGTPLGAGTPGFGFELRLDGKVDGKPARQETVTLDQAGVVLLGCHLHGSMRGHVFVSDSAWTLKTDDNGIARFADLPDQGTVQLRVWQAEQLVELPRRSVALSAAPVLETVQLSVVPRRRR